MRDVVSRAHAILREATSVLVIDWPSRDVPDTLAGAGFEVYVAGGPGSYSAVDLVDGQVVNRRVDGLPDTLDLVYAHRPIAELPRILAIAKELSAIAVWRQSGVVASGERDPTGCWVSGQESGEARAMVQSAGLKYVDDVYIADAAGLMTAEPG
ncbi:MAG: CoA-binding protein [Candidatus Dormibacteria bacterium]